MDRWKSKNPCETRSKVLAPADLKNPSLLNDAILPQDRVRVPRDIPDALESLEHPDQVADEDLPAYIGTLLVIVERKIERVCIDTLTFPCPVCRNIDTDDPLLGCSCSVSTHAVRQFSTRASGEPRPQDEESRSFELDGIKHIDSDDEEETRLDCAGNDGEQKLVMVIPPPRSIHDIPKQVLTCGLMISGCTDVAGKPIVEFLDDPSKREDLLAENISSYLLYLVRLISTDSKECEFTLLLRTKSSECVELMDKALSLLQDRISATEMLLVPIAQLDISSDFILPLSHTKVTVVDVSMLDQFILKKEQSYDQTQWIQFYKKYDSLMTEWQVAGRRLALELSVLKECTNLSGTLAPLNRLLTDPTLKKTSKDADDVIIVLEEYAAPLMHLDHVRMSVNRARRLIEEVGNAATRLELSFESRRAFIRNLTVQRNIEDQAHEVLRWLCNKGEDVLWKHAQRTSTNLSTARLHEREFEKFYFTSMRHLDKGNDLVEAANTIGLGELARTLKQHLRGFGSRLESRREYVEDTSRCFLLQDRAYEWAQEARAFGEEKAQQFLMARPPLPPEHFTEMISLAEKIGNEVLLEQCKLAKHKCVEALESLDPDSSTTRRSLLLPTSDSTGSPWDETYGKRASWDDSDSGASCPTESVESSGINGQGTSCNNNGERESIEATLESPPSSPTKSPLRRRLIKPPVNSHLQRTASVAPGMKAKKTILLIMREMIQTERDYVKSLEYIIENYIPELIREDIPQALRGQRNVVFGNVEKIYEFHSMHFLHELEQCEQSPMRVGQCFLRHENKFYLYALYNKNKPNSDSLMAEYGTAFFKQKQMELGDKMDLASYLLKPVQRMGKYALLLQQLVKAGNDLAERMSEKDNRKVETKIRGRLRQREENSRPIIEDEADLRAAEQMVRFQLRHGNDLLAMDSLRDCDVNVKEQGRLLRQNEFLVWQGKSKKCLRQVFLFEDLILFSKARRFPDRKNLDIYIYKHSIKTTDIGLTAVIADSPTKFEIWFRKRKPGDTYTLQCASEEIKNAWTEELSNLLWKQALRNREVRLAEMSSMGIGNKPCLDIRPSADQINDRSISAAQLSKTAPRFRNSFAVSAGEDVNRCNRRPHSVISVSSSSSSGGSSGPPTTLNLTLDTSPRPHHRSTTLNSQCSIESGIIADISIVSDDSTDCTDRIHWNSNPESPTTPQLPTTSTPLESPTDINIPIIDNNLTQYNQDMSINL